MENVHNYALANKGKVLTEHYGKILLLKSKI